MWWLLREWLGDAAVGALVMMWVHQHQEAQPPPSPPSQVEAPPSPAPPIARPPVSHRPPKGRRVAFKPDENDQCYQTGAVYRGSVSASFPFLFDSGNGGPPAFGPQHAIALGLDPSQLVYDREIWTANGVGRAARIHIDELRIDGLVFRNLPADVEKGGLDTPLLSAAILKRFNFQYSDGECAITLPEARRASSRPSPDAAADPLESLGLKLAASGFSIGGVIVAGVEPDGIAAGKGLRPGDFISEVNETEVSSPQQVADGIAQVQRKRGNKILLMVRREGEPFRFVTLRVPPA